MPEIIVSLSEHEVPLFFVRARTLITPSTENWGIVGWVLYAS